MRCGCGGCRITDRELVRPSQNSTATPAITGTRITLHSNRDGNREIYGMDANGSNQIRLTNNLADCYYPSWVPAQ